MNEHLCNHLLISQVIMKYHINMNNDQISVDEIFFTWVLQGLTGWTMPSKRRTGFEITNYIILNSFAPIWKRK